MVKVEYTLYNKKTGLFSSKMSVYYDNMDEYKRGYESKFNAWLRLNRIMFINRIVEE